MYPLLTPNQLIFGSSLLKKRVNRVVVFRDNEIDKVKLILKKDKDKYFVVGSNLNLSTDSRHFGWIKDSQVIGVMIWPRIKNKKSIAFNI
ncbi:MAG: S26 family signal peptidase [Patescibacteria group bacterium]|jgi:hypothetical protein|nr:S26 family signal peptidase [Patescibacteria group bacterium]